MGNLFDKLAKDAAADMPRRQAFRRIGGALIGVVLAAVGLSADKDACRKACFICCNNNFSQPKPGKDGGGLEHAQCIQDCHEGAGVCWPPCPPV